MPVTPSITHFFTGLGLDPGEIALYLTLSGRGQMTVLELSRTAKIPRTRAYRLLEHMKTRGFVEGVVDEHRMMYRAVASDILERQVANREEVVRRLRQQLPGVLSELTANIGSGSGDTTVRYYRGKEGIRQMVWHTLRAEQEVVGYTFRKIDEVVGREFERDWREAFIAKNLTFRDIYSDEYLTSKGKDQGWKDYPQDYYQSRFISRKILDIRIQMDIYNDVVAQYSWHGGEIFGVEIYNPTLVAFQKQLFELVWCRAVPE